MKKILKTPISSVLALSFLAVVQAGAAVLIQDDFNDNSLNSSIWTVDTDNSAHTRALDGVISEVNGQMEFNGRPRLLTTTAINPDDYAGGIMITGQIEFASPDDVFQIVTRTDNTKVTSGPARFYAELATGVSFSLNANGTSSVPTIVNRGGFTLDALVTTGDALDFDTNSILDFVIIDNGAGGLSFTVTDQGSGDSATTTTSITGGTAVGNLIAFYNRESQIADTMLSNLDNVTISSVPEPSSAFLLGLSGVALMIRRRRG
ncbi:PEP-CTERM sorting domain-containing protein [Rubritalea spongiae]|uniref:PEP-CTERM sorting domain-containing protein n=1 Tax=Rubritalea spongiae TaxID=430797 RepID=A0ABW5E4G2_9BACT